MTKTNVMRLLDQAKIPYRTASYDYDENDLNGMHAAEGIGMEPETVFKTLVARGEKHGCCVFCIPVCCSLDLKKAAKAAGEKAAGADGLYPRRMQSHRHEKGFPHLSGGNGSALR